MGLLLSKNLGFRFEPGSMYCDVTIGGYIDDAVVNRLIYFASYAAHRIIQSCTWCPEYS